LRLGPPTNGLGLAESPFMKKFIFGILFLHSAWALASDCDLLFIQHLTRGHEYSIQPTAAIRSDDNDRVWSETETKKLIFIGKMPRAQAEDYYVFADRDRNTYYLEGRRSRANGFLIATLLVHSEANLPAMVKQTDGSCNVCAQVMAANGARERRGLPPLSYTGDEAERDETLQQHSYFAIVRQFLHQMYALNWPNGYVPGETARMPIFANLRNLSMLTVRIRAMAALSADLKGSELTTRKTKSALDFMEHMQNAKHSDL
jgi:hypothetical protein